MAPGQEIKEQIAVTRKGIQNSINHLAGNTGTHKLSNMDTENRPQITK